MAHPQAKEEKTSRGTCRGVRIEEEPEAIYQVGVDLEQRGEIPPGVINPEALELGPVDSVGERPAAPLGDLVLLYVRNSCALLPGPVWLGKFHEDLLPVVRWLHGRPS